MLKKKVFIIFLSPCQHLASIGSGSRKTTTTVAIAGPRSTTCHGDNSHAREAPLESPSRISGVVHMRVLHKELLVLSLCAEVGR